MIHRKNTLEKLRAEKARYLTGDPIRDSVVVDITLFEEAMQLVEAQDELIKKLGSSLRNSRKNVRNLHKVVDSKAEQVRKLQEKLVEANRLYDSLSERSVQRAIERDDAVKIVKKLNDTLKALNEFRVNHPRALMSITEQIEFHKKKE